MNFDLGRTRRLMRLLGDPQSRFAAVHVAGTNGKGSVAAMVAGALCSGGRRTALYTSPHLETPAERFQINGRRIPAPTLDRLAGRIAALDRSGALPVRPTQFEALTAVAFLWFAEENVDIAVVEVGLGGRLDATNVLDHVAVSVITNIGPDHTAWLGATPAAIAREKAGIVRLRTPVVTAAEGAALGVIRSVAVANRAPLTVVRNDFSGPVGLAGPHQRRNAAVAERTIERLRRQGFRVPAPAARSAIASVVWPGRFERFTLRAGQNRISLVLDGAHNVPAARALAATLREERMGGCTLLFGALRDKNVAGIARELAPLARRVFTVTVPSDRAVSAEELARTTAWRNKARPSAMASALRTAVLATPDGGSVVVAGSLYLVGALRAACAKGVI